VGLLLKENIDPIKCSSSSCNSSQSCSSNLVVYVNSTVSHAYAIAQAMTHAIAANVVSLQQRGGLGSLGSPGDLCSFGLGSLRSLGGLGSNEDAGAHAHGLVKERERRRRKGHDVSWLHACVVCSRYFISR